MYTLFSVARLVTGMGNGSDRKVASDHVEQNDIMNRDEDTCLTIDEEIIRMEQKIKSEAIQNHHKLHPVIFWNPPPLVYLDELTDELHLNAYTKDFKARSLQGEYFYEPKAGTVLSAGNQTLTVTFVPTKAHKYLSVTETREVTVHRRRPQVQWDFPYKEIVFGTVLADEHFSGVQSELPGGSFTFSHSKDIRLPIGIHKMTVEYEPSDEYRQNYCRGYASVTFEVVGTYVPIVWEIPFSVESYAFFTKHIEAMADARTTVVSSPAKTLTRYEAEGPPGSRRRNRRQQDAKQAQQAKEEAARPVTPGPVYTPDSTVIVTTLPSAKRSSAFFAGAPIIYPEPLPSWLYGAQAVFYDPDKQESEFLSGRFEYDPPEGAKLNAGTYTIRMTFYPDDLLRYRITKDSRRVNILKSPVPLDWPLNVGITEGALLDETTLNCTNLLNLPGNYVYDPPAGTGLLEGRHILKVQFDPEDSTNYHSASTTVEFQVRHKKIPSIAWSEPPDIVHPFPLSKLQLNAACRGGGFYRGRFVYEPDFDAVLDAGQHTLKVTFYPELPTVMVVTATVPLTVHKGLSRLVWNSPEPLCDGQGLYDDTLTCKCTNLTGGTFIYDPPKGTMLNAGPHRLTVRYIPDDPNYAEAEAFIKMQVQPKKVRTQSKFYRA